MDAPGRGHGANESSVMAKCREDIQVRTAPKGAASRSLWRLVLIDVMQSMSWLI